MHHNITEEKSPRRRELLLKGLGHGTIELLRATWYPTIGNFDHLYPEWEVRDYNGGFRYLDLAYMPAKEKGCIEVQGFGPHARDLDTRRFKDLCMKQALLGLDDWLFLPIAYLSIKEDPEKCKQLVLAFVGKFLASSVPANLDWAGAETFRYARRLVRPFTAGELALHLRISDRHSRRILHELVDRDLLAVINGNRRYRTYQLRGRR